jgi:hypothetical protein
MSGENEGAKGPQTGPQTGHWLDDARDALSKRAGEQGQEWLGQAQDGVHNAGQQAGEWAGHVQHTAQGAFHDATGYAAAPAGQWVNGEWIADAHDAAAGYGADAHEAALGALGHGHEAAAGAAAGTATLDLNDRDRLPWLENQEEDEDYYAVDTRRVIAAVLGGLLVLALVVGGVWALTHRKGEGTPVADGSVIGGSDQPYKQAPATPGGKQFEGTGDTSFAAAQGKDRPAQLANGDAAPAAKDAAKPDTGKAAAPKGEDAKPAAAAATADAGPVGGVVQIAAYSSEAVARAGWDRLVQQHEMLKGANHRIVQGQADIGTVYRLQLITGAGGGSALCEKLKGEGVPCQVKH